MAKVIFEVRDGSEDLKLVNQFLALYRKCGDSCSTNGPIFKLTHNNSGIKYEGDSFVFQTQDIQSYVEYAISIINQMITWDTKMNDIKLWTEK